MLAPGVDEFPTETTSEGYLKRWPLRRSTRA